MASADDRQVSSGVRKHDMPFMIHHRVTQVKHVDDAPQQPHAVVSNTTEAPALLPTVLPYAGRVGASQGFVLNQHDPANAAELARFPDAAPFMPFRRLLNLRGFMQIELYKAAMMEGVGTFMLDFLTIWISLHPGEPLAPDADNLAAIYGTAGFYGPLIGGVTNWIIVTLLIYCFASVSGGHLNPLITFATFFTRLTSFPRMVLYVTAQIIGGSLAGLMIRATYETRHFDVGGCGINTSQVTVGSAFALEFTCSLILLFMAYGVGLDPRQKRIFGPALGPALVGLALGVVSFGSAFVKRGDEGASMNPTRCFAAFIGSRFPGYHWIHWVGPIAAGLVHAVFYHLVPPWTNLVPDETTLKQAHLA